MYVVISQNKWMLWSYFPALTMFEFINQYHLFLSEQPFPTSHTNCKIELQRHKERPIITYQPYRGIYVICTSVTAVCYHFALKSNPLSGEFIYTVEKSKWYPFINWWYKNISSFDMKQSVVSIGSQYTMVWQALWQRWRKA